jgi:hypothetical protein
MTHPDLDAYDQQADAVHFSYARRTDAILGDRDLNPEAQRRQLDEATTDARAQLARLLAARAAKRDSIKTSLTRGLFGYIVTPTGTDLLVRRDADERAARLAGPEEALDALERADLTGDRILARSITLAALTRGWPAVVNAYRSTHPADAEALDSLDAIEVEAASGLYGIRYSLLARTL